MTAKIDYKVTGLDTAFTAFEPIIAKAATKAMKEIGEQEKTEGRAAIASAGFGLKWQNAWRVNTYPKSGTSLGPAVWAYHKIGYSGVFETGAKIVGSPLLWLPLPGLPQRLGGRRFTPQTYVARYGPLISLHVPGKPPMLAGYIGATGRFRKRGGGPRLPLVPLFVGLPMVKIRQRFRLGDLTKRVAARVSQAYYRNLGVV